MMNRYRIAVLIFLVGVSAANFFVAKQSDDFITGATPRTGTVFFGIRAFGTHLGTFGVAEAHTRIRYAAVICEAIILTVCGVAWFLIPNCVKS